MKVTIENVTYKCPSSWNDVSVAMFEDLLNVVYKEESYNTEVEYALDIMATLTNIPLNILKSIKDSDFVKLSEAMSWSQIEVTGNNKKEFVINDVKYVPVSNFNGLTMGEAIDSELIIKDSTGSNLLTNLLPLLVRKAKEDGTISEYDSKDYYDNKELLKHNLMITDVIQLKGFF